jgi:hypothetical protein
MSDMFHSVYGSFDDGDKNPSDRKNDGQGEPKKKPSRTSEVGARHPDEGLEDVAHSATLHAHHDGSYSVETPEEGLHKHDTYEEASEHLSHAVGRGDEFGMGEEKHRAGSKPSIRTKNPPRDDMSGAGM